MIIVRPIVNILFVIYNYVGDFGLAIILFTIVVKILTWPLIKKQLHQSRIMRKIQPEMAKIKENCKGNRQLETLQMMDLYKRYNYKPFHSIFTLFIQIPIFIALFTAINVMVIPTSKDNLYRRAYSFIQPMERVQPLITKQKAYLEDPAKTTYDFRPQLFGVVDLNVRAGVASISAIVVLLFALSAAGTQMLISKQLMPSDKTKKHKSFRQILKETSGGKDPDQAELNSMMTSQMTKIMPIMMLLIMINLPGALVFYYLLNNVITAVQQNIILNRSAEELEISADKAVLKKLRNIQEAEVIENKKTGTKITKISAKDNKRRKK